MKTHKVVVVGGGVAGCSAALEAAKLGLAVTLVDEHPQSLQAMSLDAPYFYGARLAPVLGDSSVVAERVLGSNEPLIACLDAGVDVVTGTCAWGSFRSGPNATSLKVAEIGLADAERSWMLAYDDLIIATGSRDLVLSFPGWHLPGVLGANGATALLSQYQALSGSQMVLLGSGNLAMRTAKLALQQGVRVAGIIDVCSAPRGNAGLANELSRAGIPFLMNHTVESAIGESEVRSIRIVGADDQGQLLPGTEQKIECDTVCMAIGAVPNVELPSITGCRIGFDDERGGWSPIVDADFRSNVPNVYIVGEAAGVDERMIIDAQIATEQGQRAAQAIAAGNGHAKAAAHVPGKNAGNGMMSYAGAWLRALTAAGGLDVVICQCEDITRREVLDLRPPKYLGAGNARQSGGISRLSSAGRGNQDLVKRLTRAGMGHCQGKRCRDQVALLLAAAAQTDISDIVIGSYRAPIRPLPLKVLWADDETEETRRAWPIWLHPVEEGAPGYASTRAGETDHG